jgi:bifunctional N-acetylglucosamine-1-phosphate-uridyltransferase/glucosamine-1-phosphate-acetyltransferase GlmU-like protein
MRDQRLSFDLLVPAAGLGTRMGGGMRSVKALVLVGGMPLIRWATGPFYGSASRSVLVVRPSQVASFRAAGFGDWHVVHQTRVNGTACAVRQGLNSCLADWVYVVWADHAGANLFPVLPTLDAAISADCDILIPVVARDDPYVYFALDASGVPIEVVETKHGPRVDRGISDCGVFLGRRVALQHLFDSLGEDVCDAVGEVNFLTVLCQAHGFGLKVLTHRLYDERLTMGINSPEDSENFVRAMSDE